MLNLHAISKSITTLVLRLWPSGMDVKSGTEGGQAVVRMKCSFYFLVACFLFNYLGFYLYKIWLVSVIYVVFAYVLGFVIGFELFPRGVRIFLSILLDGAIFSVGFYYAQEAFALALWVPMFASIGYGLRYDENCVIGSIFCNVTFSSVAMWFSLYWHSHPLVSIGILAGMGILPLYAFQLSSRIAKDKEEFERRFASLDLESKLDTLTGLLNRRGLVAYYDLCLASNKGGVKSGLLMFVDLDGFKLINDIAGHLKGDWVLREVALKISGCLRSGDKVARFGGDEFIILMRDDLSIEDVEYISERILQEIKTIEVPGFPGIGVDASIGVNFFNWSKADNFENILNLADEAMYKAKKAGKGRSYIQTDVC